MGSNKGEFKIIKGAKNPIIFVGAGPGDPELITVKGKKALENADLIIYAGSLVPEKMLKWTKDKCERVNSAKLPLELIVRRMVEAYKHGKKVVRVHSGDPSLYGAIQEQIVELEKLSIPYEIIPGVTAAFAAAAAMGCEYTLPDISQTLILTRVSGRTNVPEDESLRSLAAHKTSMAIYLSISFVDEVSKILKESYGKKAHAVIAYKLSQPGQKIIYTTLEEMPEIVRKEKIGRQALIIVGRVLSVKQSGPKKRSKVYHKDFSHTFRK